MSEGDDLCRAQVRWPEVDGPHTTAFRSPGVNELPTASGMPVPYVTVYLLADRKVAEPEFADTHAPGGLAIGCRCVLGEDGPTGTNSARAGSAEQ